MSGLRALRRSVARADVKQDQTVPAPSHVEEVKGVAGAIASAQHLPLTGMGRRARRGLVNVARRLVLNRKSG